MKTIKIIDLIGTNLNHTQVPAFFTGSMDGESLKADFQCYCRETFGGSYFSKNTKMVGYYNPSNGKGAGYSNHIGMDYDAAVAFWREIEKRLGLKPCEFFKGSIPNTIVMAIDPFWTINHTRRGFFTMLLRCACSWAKGKDFEADLEAYSYTKVGAAGNAVRHFLAGNTTPTYEDDTHHIYNRFRGMEQKTLRDSLVKLIEV